MTGSERRARHDRSIALVTHSYYEEDPRVRRQAETLASAGWRVDVFALRRPGDTPDGSIAGVQIHHLAVRRHQGAGLWTYLAEYFAFFVRVAIALAAAGLRRRYSIIQVATLPDWLVFAAVPWRLARVPVVLDLHEAMPEFFRSRFPTASGTIVQRILLAQERLSIGASTHVLTVNDALADRLRSLGVAPGHVTVVPNTPSLGRFDPALEPGRLFMADGVLRLVYAGALTPTYELDVAIRALGILRQGRPELGAHLDIYGRGDSRAALEALISDIGLETSVTLHGRIAIEAIPAAIAAADIGLAPTRRDRYTDASLSTKIFEYAAMGKPVVASSLPLVERTFGDDTIGVYRPGDSADLAHQIEALVDEPGRRAERVSRATDLVRERSWEHDSRPYLELLGRLAGHEAQG